MRKPAPKAANSPKDALSRAEAFIEKVILPRRQAEARVDAKALGARVRLDRQNLDLARGELAKAGFDPKRLDSLAAERSNGLKKLADDARRRAVDESASVRDRLQGLIPPIVPLDPMDITIDQVTFIRSFAGQGVVLESNIGPQQNWARYQLQSSSDAWNGTGRLSFFTLWENQLSVPATVIAKANLVINANLSCDCDWSGVAAWFGMSSVGNGKVRLCTTVWGMDSSVSSIVQQQQVADTGEDGGFFGGSSSAPIAFNQMLPATGVVVGAETYILIEVEVLTDWSANGGASVSLDAQSGSHRIDLPQLVLTVTPTTPPPPPISLTAGVDHFTTPPSVLLIWTGATGAQVDIYQDGVRIGNTLNDGAWSQKYTPGTYTFRICDQGSSVCSADVTVTVT